MGSFSVFWQFVATAQILRVNYDEMNEDKPRQLAKLVRTVTARLSRVT